MERRQVVLGGAAIVFSVSLGIACSSSSSSPAAVTTVDAAVSDSSSSVDANVADVAIRDAATSAVDAPSPTTTIADARQRFLDAGAAPAITVNAIVTAVQGPSGDQVTWYVEDPAGGPYSGISVYCDPLAAKTCPCMAGCTPHVEAPPLNTLVSITGTLTAYHGQLQLEPTAQTTIAMNATPPPVYTAALSDLAETGNSPYRGVFVKFPSAVTVDDLTPAALYDSQCSVDGGMTLCTGCAPPTYSGFEVNAADAGAFFVQETFFPFVTLQNSPECLTQSGAVAVTNGETFPSIAGILDVDPYSLKQTVAPAQPSDYGM